MTSSDHALSSSPTVVESVVAEQLEVHLPLPPATVLVVGSATPLVGRLSAAGYEVTTSPDVLELDDALAADRLFDVVVAHDVLPHLPDPNPAVRALGRRLADDAILSVVTYNAAALAWDAVLAGEAGSAAERLDEQELARRERRDAVLVTESGAVRADTIERLGAFLGGSRVGVEAWYGVGITPAPAAPTRAHLDLDLRLGRTEPYKRLGRLLHVVGRRGVGRGPQLDWAR